MQRPLQITFRHMDPSPAIEARIREEAEKLEQFWDRITGCRVTFECSHPHHRKGNLYHVSIDISVPGRDIVVNREHHDKHAHEDPYVALRDAFRAADRQLEDFARRQRGEVKTHLEEAHGRVVRIVREEDHGFLESPAGEQLYFHRNSVLDGAFDRLQVGSAVRYVAEQGAEGPQASTVALL